MTKKKEPIAAPPQVERQPRMIIESGKLIKYLDAIRAVAPDCRLEITKDGLEVIAVDTGNVALVKASMPAAAFKEYGIPPKEIGLDLERLKSAMPLLLGEDITLTLVAQGSRLEFTGGGTTYTNALLDVNTLRKRPTMPALRIPAGFETTPEILAKVFSATSLIQDKILLEVADSRAVVTAESSEGDKLQTPIECSIYPDKADKGRGIYSLDYLKAIVKGLKGMSLVECHLGQDSPLQFIAKGDHEITYLMAPRIEDDITAPPKEETPKDPEKKKPSVGAPGTENV